MWAFRCFKVNSMRRLRIYADFNGLRISPRNHERYAVALDTFGSLLDLSNAGIRLTEEMPLVIFDWSDENEDLEGHCTVYYDWQRQFWWAELDEQGVLDVPRDERKPVTEFLCLGCRSDLTSTNCFPENFSVETMKPAIIAGKDSTDYIFESRSELENRCPFCGTPINSAIAPPEDKTK